MATFTFVVEFRGGTYCSQVEATDLMYSLSAWIEKVVEHQKEIKHLGSKMINELKVEVLNSNNRPTKLTGLKNVWYVGYSTYKGLFHLNIIQTDTA